jgi:hypothetical protein
MYEFLQRRKKLLNQYKELSKRLPKNFMDIHFKSINIKNKDIKTNLFPEEIFVANNNQQIMKDLDSETKSFILNKNKIFNKYSNSLVNKNNEKKKKINFINNQTIILTKFNDDSINENKNNINKTIDDIIFNKDLDKMCEKKRNKYKKTFTNGIYQSNYTENIKENNFSKDTKIKGKTLSQSFYSELNKMKNRKRLELTTNEKESNKNIIGYKEIYNNIINNNKNCQTSFSSVKQKSLNKNLKENNNKKWTLLKNEEKDNMKNNKENNENNKWEKDFNNNHKNIKEIKFKSVFYNTYNNEDKKREQIMENSEKINLKKGNINDKKERMEKKKIELMTPPLFSNFTIRGNIINNHKGYNSSGKIKEKFNKLNYLYINTDDLKNKENYLYGTNYKFIGKSLKNYQTKNNVFLPNLSERMKEKPPRYERQFNGFILA